MSMEEQMLKMFSNIVVFTILVDDLGISRFVILVTSTFFL